METLEPGPQIQKATDMGYTLNQAAKHAQKSKGTISKAIARGTLSAKKQEDSTYDIDPAELGRWLESVSKETLESRSGLQMATHEKTHGNSALETEIKLLRERISDKDDQIAYLRERLDGEAERVTALLTDQRAQATTEPWFKLGGLRIGGKRQTRS